MANRSYLYSLSNQPTSYTDRPETISGLSEWAYAVPFSYRVLLSGDPRRCASLIADGFEDDTPERQTTLHAITGEFDQGRARLRKLCAAVRAVADRAPGLIAALDETETFLDSHRDRFLLLETIELDSMTEGTEAGLRACVEAEIDRCREAGAAVDALPPDPAEAGAALAQAARSTSRTPLAAFTGLTLTDDFDNVRQGGTEHPLGLSWWTDVLYYELFNRAQFAADS